MNRPFASAPPGRKGRFDLGTVSRMWWLALLACALPATASARQQATVTALIPFQVTSEQDAPLQPGAPLVISGGQFGSSGVKLRFNLNVLPPGANLTAARLSLVSSGLPSASQTVNVDEARSLTRLGAQTLTRKAGRAYWPLNSKFVDTVNAGGKDFLLLMTTGSSARSSWHSMDSAEVNNRPRLILEYTVPGQPLTQSDGLPAVRSPRAFLPLRDGSTRYHQLFSYVARPFPKAWSYTPVFFNNMVYLITDDSGRRTLRAFDALGNQVWSQALGDAAVGQHLLGSRDGRLFIVGAGRILAYQLDPSDPSKLPYSPRPGEVKADNLNPSIPPSSGADGALYFVNGQEVYAFNRALQQLWKVTLSDKRASRVTVGPSGRFVYLTTAGEEGLVTVNAQTGDSFSNPLPNQDALRSAENPALHAPVVIQHPDGSEKIYAAADTVNSGTLALFNNLKTMPGRSETGAVERAGAGWPLTGLWSQPIPDHQSPGGKADPNSSKQLYAVSVENGIGTLKAVNWLSGATTNMAPQFRAVSPYLLNGGNLALDQAGNRVVWNGVATGGLYVFGTEVSDRLGLLAAGDIPVKTQWYFGSDGTLYANDVDGRVLRAVVPSTHLGEDAGSNIASPTHLHAQGAVTRDTTLAAGGGVIIGGEFKVPRGTTLTIRTGVPPR